jgi:hypothetical protein
VDWPRPNRISIKYKNLKTVLSGEPEKLAAAVLTLCILYEDLRLELGELDESVKPLRNIYFLRRATATLREFVDSIITLDGIAEFHPIRARFTDFQRGKWNSSVAFLRAHKKRIFEERNYYGGHVSVGAVARAVGRLQYGTAGGLEIGWIESDQSDRIAVRLSFVDEVVGLIMLHGKSETAEAKKYVRDLVGLTAEGFNAATTCVNIVADQYLAPRFGF